MKKNKKRQAQLAERAKAESLHFQTMWGARQKFAEVTPDIEERINDELQLFSALGLAPDLLTLKTAIDTFTRELSIESKPSKGILAGSVVAYCLGLEPTNPFEAEADLGNADFELPVQLTITFSSDDRSKAVDWLNAHSYDVTTYLGQPLLKLDSTRVVIRRESRGQTS